MHEYVLIFDYGNVVAFFDYMRACERFGSRVGLTGEEFRERIVERGFNQLMIQFESGRIAPEEFADQVMGLSGLSLPYHEFIALWQDIFWLNEPVARLIRFLKSRGYSLLLGSNTNILHAAHFRRKFAATLDLLDHLVLSHEVGFMKPDKGFYEACLSTAGVPAASCVFVDDVIANVEGAGELGLIGLHYRETPALIAELGRLGVEVPATEG
jgi:HAD superfamily hydrolase (TIGR01509 family)